MKIARFSVDGQVRYGIVNGEELSEIRGSIYKKFKVTDIKHNLKNVVLLPPTNPSEIWCPGLNFANHLEYAAEVLGEENPTVPKHPEPWIKARSSLTGTGNPIILPLDCSGEVHYEGEAVAVIGKLCRRVTVQDAPQFVLGYTCGNDVSDRVWQRDDWTFWRAKGADTFSPVGPWIETDCYAQDLHMIVRVNGNEVQHGKTEEMLFGFGEIISYISQQVTLYPGDLVFSGSTGVTVALNPGDVVEVDIPGIGVLSNPVVAEVTL